MTKVNYKKNHNHFNYFLNRLRILIEVQWNKIESILKTLVIREAHEILSK
jgi:hypothetical protein